MYLLIAVVEIVKVVLALVAVQKMKVVMSAEVAVIMIVGDSSSNDDTSKSNDADRVMTVGELTQKS